MTHFFFTYFLALSPYPALAAALGPLACASRSSRPPSLPSRPTWPTQCVGQPNPTNSMILLLILSDATYNFVIRFVAMIHY